MWQRLVSPYWFDHQSEARKSANRLRAKGLVARVRGEVRPDQGPARWWFVEYRQS